MLNKRHNIIDDAWEMKEEIMGGPEHTFRVGLVTNTVLNAMPIVIDDVKRLVLEDTKIDHSNLEKDLPVLLNFKAGEVQVAILLVYDKDTKHIQCYPFSNLNEGEYWWLYEMAFDITPGGLIEVRPVHPLVEEMDPTQEMMNHLESLVTIIRSFIHRLQAGEITVYEGTEDFTKINRKRVKNKKEPIINNWYINYVQLSPESAVKD